LGASIRKLGAHFRKCPFPNGRASNPQVKCPTFGGIIQDKWGHKSRTQGGPASHLVRHRWPPDHAGRSAHGARSSGCTVCNVPPLLGASNRTNGGISGPLMAAGASHMARRTAPSRAGFAGFFCGFSSHPGLKKLGTVGTNGKNARKSLSPLKKVVPKTTGDKSFFCGDTGDSQF